MTLWAAIKAIWSARKALAKADKTVDAHRDKLKARIIKRGAACVLLCLVAGCATSSVRAVRAQGGQPTCWERAQLNACDTVSWINGVVPFGGGQD